MTFCPRAVIRKRTGYWHWLIGSIGGTTLTLEAACDHSALIQHQLMTATLCDAPRDERGVPWVH